MFECHLRWLVASNPKSLNWRHFVFTAGNLRGSKPGGIYAFVSRDSPTNDLPEAGYAPEGLDPIQPAAGVGSRRRRARRAACAAGTACTACTAYDADSADSATVPTVPTVEARGSRTACDADGHRTADTPTAMTPVRCLRVRSNHLFVLLSLL